VIPREAVMAVVVTYHPDAGIAARVGKLASQDERNIQKRFLVEAFAERPLMGAGFGSTARYLRSYERPWTSCELTYHQMLFNLGIVGTALLAAFCSLLLGAYSNRYFGSFDLLFFAGLLPFLATFTGGFAASAPAPAASAVPVRSPVEAA
jgi:O-antigen ligase